ncbi:hypothetical protein [Marinobacter salarius]
MQSQLIYRTTLNIIGVIVSYTDYIHIYEITLTEFREIRLWNVLDYDEVS